MSSARRASLVRRHSHPVKSTVQDSPAGDGGEGNRDQPTRPRPWGFANWQRSHQDNEPPSLITELEVYYGTMFGAAEKYARALAHDISSRHPVAVHVQDLDAFDEETFARRDRLTPSRVVVFVVSTHFAGAPSPSAERFRGFLKRLVEAPPGSRSPTKLPCPSRTRAWRGLFSGFGILPSRFRRRHPLAGMQYTVFGVGDSVYLTYNAMGKFVDAKLKQLGATRFHELGLGDCSNNVDRLFKAWEAALLQKLPAKTSAGMSPSLPLSAASPSQRKLSRTTFSTMRSVYESTARRVRHEEDYHHQYSLHVPEAVDAEEYGVQSADRVVRDSFGGAVRLLFRCFVLSNDELPGTNLHRLGAMPSLKSVKQPSRVRLRTPRVAIFDDEPFADIVPVECVGFASGPTPPTRRSARTMDVTPRAATFKVRLLNAAASYSVVNTLAIIPQNSEETVDALATAFGYDLDAVIELRTDETRHEQLPFPTPCTVRTALTEFLELNSLTRDFVRVAAGFVTTEEERDLLSSLASTSESSAFRTQIQDQHRGVLDLVAIAPSLRIPLEVFVNIASTIRPRYFTIASSPVLEPRDIDLAVLLGRPGQPQGLAVSYFERILATHSRVPLRGFISSSRFQFQDDGVSPMILIASGVGFAAMRAIITDRLARWVRDQAAQNQPSSRVLQMPNHILFLGTTNQDTIVFQNDLRHWEQQLFVKVHYAFSNDRHQARRYVQDIVTTRIDEVVHVVQSSSTSRVFVCGRTAMVHRIREIFKADQACRGSTWFDTIHKSGRFIEEGYN